MPLFATKHEKALSYLIDTPHELPHSKQYSPPGRSCHHSLHLSITGDWSSHPSSSSSSMNQTTNASQGRTRANKRTSSMTSKQPVWDRENHREMTGKTRPGSGQQHPTSESNITHQMCSQKFPRLRRKQEYQYHKRKHSTGYLLSPAQAYPYAHRTI